MWHQSFQTCILINFVFWSFRYLFLNLNLILFASVPFAFVFLSSCLLSPCLFFCSVFGLLCHVVVVSFVPRFVRCFVPSWVSLLYEFPRRKPDDLPPVLTYRCCREAIGKWVRAFWWQSSFRNAIRPVSAFLTRNMYHLDSYSYWENSFAGIVEKSDYRNVERNYRPLFSKCWKNVENLFFLENAWL